MGKVYQGLLSAEGVKFGLICSRFNEFITTRLLEGAKDALLRHKAREEDIDIVWVPGSFEIPTVASRLAQQKKYDALICLGAVIRGETPHFDYVAAEVAKGIAKVAIETLTPTIFGIITADSIDQAIERAGTKQGNKGWFAALAAIEMVDLMKKL
jgi:6,7-dimethyl-8-ribityllumazine synthase